MSGGWMSEVRALPLHVVAQQLGLEVRRGGSLSCPGCGALARSQRRHSGRAAIGCRGDNLGWQCHRCKVKGDAVTLCSIVLMGERTFPAGDPRWQELRDKIHQRGILTGNARTFRPRRPPPAPPLPRPPAGEVKTLWESSLSVLDDDEVLSWLHGRALDPSAVAASDLARALPRRGALPPWAKFNGKPWSRSGHRLLLQAFGMRGAPESIRARNIDPTCPKSDKSGAAAMGAGSNTGLLYANHLARSMLRAGGRGEPARLLVVEGEPDWLSWATAPSAIEESWAVVGLWAGAWTDQLARRVPDGSTVVLRTHLDPSGRDYAQKVVASLILRPIEIHQLMQEQGDESE